MTAFWTEPDFDDHERVELVHDRASGLTVIFALHSTHLGPGAGGTRFWHYPDPGVAMRDALRLSRGMSYKNAMAGLPMGGGKAVILADEGRNKSSEILAAFGDAIDALGGVYVTAEDVGMTEADMVAISVRTQFVAGLPGPNGQVAGGSPGPWTALGIFQGIEAAAAHKLRVDSLKGVRVAIQGTGSVGGALAKHLVSAGALVTLSDVNVERAKAVAESLGLNADKAVVPPDEIMSTECDVFSPNALGAVFDEQTIEKLGTSVVAGGANNQLARPEHGQMLADRGVLYAPDYVINAGGIISVTQEYLARTSGSANGIEDVHAKLRKIPERLAMIWQTSDETQSSPDKIADAMAQRLIGR